MALDLIAGVLPAIGAELEFEPVVTANALRAVIESGSTASTVERARGLLGPADNHGGLVSFRYLVPLSGVLVLIFGLLYIRERRSGGYRAERLS